MSLKTIYYNLFKQDKSRDFLLDQMPKNGVCAEVGTWKGTFAQRILQRNQPKKLYLIDPYLFIPSYEGAIYGGVAGSQEPMDDIY